METTYHEQRAQGPMVSPAETAERFPGLDLAPWRAMKRVFPVRISRSWLKRVKDHAGPLGRQVIPDARELLTHPTDVPDPVGEQGRMPHPWVVQKYTNRALLLVTRQCHVHCRYCFRRDLPGEGEPSPAELESAIDYLRHAGLDEVILSGGDPLVLSDDRLVSILDALRPDVPHLRIHTRAPITFPQRVTAELAQLLQARRPLRVVIHANHSQELDADVRRSIRMLVDTGLPILNQSVLLAGVNDDPDVLAELHQSLQELGVEPYYLHHTDHAPGNGSFRVEVKRGLEIVRALHARVEGASRYVIDPPDGAGKVPVIEWAARMAARSVPFR